MVPRGGGREREMVKCFSATLQRNEKKKKKKRKKGGKKGLLTAIYPYINLVLFL